MPKNWSFLGPATGVLIAAAMLHAPAARGQDVQVAEARLLAFITNEDGSETSFDTEVVPLIPGRSCFHWYLRFEPPPSGEVKFSERYQLPAPAEFTGEDGGPPPDSVISENSDAIETKMRQTPEDGWISHGWCLTEGDPLGPYSIEVIAGGESLQRFDFEVVPEDQFEMPELEPLPKDKSKPATNV